MRMLTAVLNDNEIQQYIYEHEDYAFSYLKENLSIEPIFNYIIENINSFISDDDLEYSYESIKSVSRNYVLRILNEADPAYMSLAPATVAKQIQIAAQNGNQNSLEAVISNTANRLTPEQAIESCKATMAANPNVDLTSDEYQQILMNLPKAPEATSTPFMHKIASYFGSDGVYYWNSFKDLINDNQDKIIQYSALSLAATIALLGAHKIYKTSKKGN